MSSSGSDSANSGEKGSDEGPESATMEDRACVLGLPKKDFARGPNVNQLDGVSTKQLAYALSCVDSKFSASDLLECGGERVPWLQSSVEKQCWLLQLHMKAHRTPETYLIQR